MSPYPALGQGKQIMAVPLTIVHRLTHDLPLSSASGPTAPCTARPIIPSYLGHQRPCSILSFHFVPTPHLSNDLMTYDTCTGYPYLWFLFYLPLNPGQRALYIALRVSAPTMSYALFSTPMFPTIQDLYK
jgi:hypothetical protein